MDVSPLINVEGLNKTSSGREKVVFYDANGKTIDSLENITLSQEEVDYTVVVHKKKNLQLSINTTGIPQSGYSLESLEISPKTISVSGNESLLENINSIDLPALDISGTNSDVSKVYSLEDYLTKGLSLAEPNNSVTVTAKIKKNAETTEESSESKEESKSTEESIAESKEESGSGSEEGSDGKQSIKNSSTTEKKTNVEESSQNSQEGKSPATENKTP